MSKVNYRFRNLNSISDIVQTMIDGLEREWVTINMGSFGSTYHSQEIKPKKFLGITYKKGIPAKRKCFGCAATNFLCELMQKPFDSSLVHFRSKRQEIFNYGITLKELENFEYAIDYLRKGLLDNFLIALNKIPLNFELPTYSEIYEDLPYLGTESWKENIGEYKKYVKWLREKGL